MASFSILFNNGDVLEYPFSYMDIINKVVNGSKVEKYLLEDGDKKIELHSSKLDFTSGNTNTFQSLQDIVDSEIKDVDLVYSVLNKHNVVTLNKLLELLSSERVQFIPKAEGIYVEVTDENYIPSAYYTINNFLSYKESLIEDLSNSPLNDRDDNKYFRLIMVLNLEGLKKGYISNYKSKSEDMQTIFINIDNFMNIYDDMNKLSKIDLMNSEITVL